MLQSDEERFGITTKEAEIVKNLLKKYLEDEEELRQTTGEEYPFLPLDSYLEKCRTKSGQFCFRVRLAAEAFTIFLFCDENTERIKAEFLSLEPHLEMFKHAECRALVQEFLTLDSLFDAAEAYRQEADLIDQDFAGARLMNLIKEGKLGEPRLSKAILDFIEKFKS